MGQSGSIQTFSEVVPDIHSKVHQLGICSLCMQYASMAFMKQYYPSVTCPVCHRHRRIPSESDSGLPSLYSLSIPIPQLDAHSGGLYRSDTGTTHSYSKQSGSEWSIVHSGPAQSVPPSCRARKMSFTETYPWVQEPLIACAPMRLIALEKLTVEVSLAGKLTCFLPEHPILTSARQVDSASSEPEVTPPISKTCSKAQLSS